MTDKEFLKKWKKLDTDTKKELLQVMEQMLRAASLGLKVSLDRSTYLFFIEDAATNTVVAPPRMLIAFLENNLNADGSVNITKALQPYMGGTEKIVPKHK